MRHHEETLVVGSVARGTERADSDVDVYLVVTDDAFARAGRRNRLSYVRRDVATYAGGYVDVKVATAPYLAVAAERG